MSNEKFKKRCFRDMGPQHLARKTRLAKETSQYV